MRGAAKKALNGLDKYLLAFSSTSRSPTTITINNKSPHQHHHISTLHTYYLTQTPNTHIATMGNGAKAASKRERNAKDAGSVAKSQLKSVRFFFPLLLLQTRHHLPPSPRAEGGETYQALLSKLTHMRRTSPRRASSAKSASRTSSRPLSDRRSRSTLPTSTARSTRTASLLLLRGFCQGFMKG